VLEFKNARRSELFASVTMYTSVPVGLSLEFDCC
jgi:hypothetical protein